MVIYIVSFGYLYSWLDVNLVISLYKIRGDLSFLVISVCYIIRWENKIDCMNCELNDDIVFVIFMKRNYVMEFIL